MKMKRAREPDPPKALPKRGLTCDLDDASKEDGTCLHPLLTVNVGGGVGDRGGLRGEGKRGSRFMVSGQLACADAITRLLCSDFAWREG